MRTAAIRILSDEGSFVPPRGSEGFLVAPCAPYGLAYVEGRAVAVVSDGGYIPEGRSVRVVSSAPGRVEVVADEDPLF